MIGRIFNVLFLFGGRAITPPLFVELLLTYRCNLSCEFCYQAPNKREIFPDMSLDDAKAIEENIRKSFFRRPRIHLFGGEPTVNKDFLAIAKYFSGEGYKLSLTSNGVDIDKYVEELSKIKGFVEIILSLNTSDMDATLATLKKFQDSEAGNRIRIGLNCPVNKENQSSLAEIVRKFEGSRASWITFQHSTYSKGTDAKVDHKIVKEQIEQIWASKPRLPVLFLPNIRINDLKDYYTDPTFPQKSDKCFFPWFVLFIQPNGDVIPCDEVDYKIGNAKKESLKEIWNSARYREFRKSIQKCGVTYPICNRCCHRQYY